MVRKACWCAGLAGGSHESDLVHGCAVWCLLAIDRVHDRERCVDTCARDGGEEEDSEETSRWSAQARFQPAAGVGILLER